MELLSVRVGCGADGSLAGTVMNGGDSWVRQSSAGAGKEQGVRKTIANQAQTTRNIILSL